MTHRVDQKSKPHICTLMVLINNVKQAEETILTHTRTTVCD